MEIFAVNYHLKHVFRYFSIDLGLSLKDSSFRSFNYTHFSIKSIFNNTEVRIRLLESLILLNIEVCSEYGIGTELCSHEDRGHRYM